MELGGEGALDHFLRVAAEPQVHFGEPFFLDPGLLSLDEAAVSGPYLKPSRRLGKWLICGLKVQPCASSLLRKASRSRFCFSRDRCRSSACLYIFSYTCGTGFFGSADRLCLLLFEDLDRRCRVFASDRLDRWSAGARGSCLDPDLEAEASNLLGCWLLRGRKAGFEGLLTLGLECFGCGRGCSFRVKGNTCLGFLGSERLRRLTLLTQPGLLQVDRRREIEVAARPAEFYSACLVAVGSQGFGVKVPRRYVLVEWWCGV